MRMEQVMKSDNVRSTTSRTRPRTEQVTFEDFQSDPELSEIHRAAQFLDWAAKHMPKRFVPYTWLTKCAYIKPRLPRVDTDEVRLIRLKKMGQIKRVLWETYSRRTVATPKGSEPGVRATVDSDDLAGTDFLRRRQRLANGVVGLQETRAKIDTGTMKDAALKAVVQNTDPVIKQLMQPDMMRRLALPPKRDDD